MYRTITTPPTKQYLGGRVRIVRAAAAAAIHLDDVLGDGFGAESGARDDLDIGALHEKLHSDVHLRARRPNAQAVRRVAPWGGGGDGGRRTVCKAYQPQRMTARPGGSQEGRLTRRTCPALQAVCGNWAILNQRIARVSA